MIQFKSLTQLLNKFKTNDDCIAYYEGVRFANGVFCPHCKSEEYYVLKRKYKYRCKNQDCKKDFNVLTGTIFENTKISLQTWFAAIFLATTGKKGISSCQLATQLGCTQKTAWHVLHRIRHMLKKKDPSKLSGEVQVDETYLDGQDKNRHANKKKGKGKSGNHNKQDKTMVGAISNGQVITKHISGRSKEEIRPFVLSVVEPGSLLVTDSYHAYRGFGGLFIQQKVLHHIKEYKNKDGYTTNGIEGYWANLKRSIYGIYHQISDKHCQKYLDEFSFRFNSRDISNEHRFILALAQTDSKLPYQVLIAE